MLESFRRRAPLLALLLGLVFAASTGGLAVWWALRPSHRLVRLCRSKYALVPLAVWGGGVLAALVGGRHTRRPVWLVLGLGLVLALWLARGPGVTPTVSEISIENGSAARLDAVRLEIGADEIDIGALAPGASWSAPLIPSDDVPLRFSARDAGGHELSARTVVLRHSADELRFLVQPGGDVVLAIVSLDG